MNWSPWVVVVLMKDAVDKEIAVVPLTTHKACNTSTAAFGWAADRRLAFHAGRAVVIEQRRANSTAACGMKLGEIPFDSSSRPPLAQAFLMMNSCWAHC